MCALSCVEVRVSDHFLGRNSGGGGYPKSLTGQDAWISSPLSIPYNAIVSDNYRLSYRDSAGQNSVWLFYDTEALKSLNIR